MIRRLFLVAIVLAAAVAAPSSLRAHLRADETEMRYGGQAEQRGANPNPNLLRFCPGSGIPCVEITREAYDRGHDQFRSSCGFCHGPTAAGGNGGPNLIFSPVIRLDEKGADITRLIQTGRPEKGMPVVPLTPAQVADIVAYLKARIAEVDLTSGRRPARDYDLKKLLTGNADRGKAYFNGAGQCATCHSADGDLKGVASKYPPIELQARFMYPTGVVKKATVTEATGAPVTGDLVRQDAFEVTIKPADGPQRSWPSDSVKVQVTDPLAKHVELLPKYTNTNMHDMFAYIQTSPRDTHDRDANQTPIQIDADYQGRPRTLIAMASRSGYYFLLDRATGESLVTVPYGGQNWSAGVDKRGQPIPREDVEPTVDGAFFEGTTTNWYSPSYSPDTRLFYVNASHGFSLGYLMPDPETGKIEDHQGGGNTSLWSENMLLAIDYQTGKIRWSRVQSGGGGGNGILTTAGGLVFTNESGRLVALDAATGKMLCNVNPGGNLSGAPMTYELAGRQFVLTPVGGRLYAWALPETR